ncbi:hypothetical protein KI688_004096 [Linnemannia hyalina]|uniref:WD40 repeat-like protein n=1 Tax=Linnemannia hyalina TaxID=64524 RepID=A0A9P7XNW6_9FUNG|nr:hypothetical protein KI688_004096 [Linnemannia hyalina]
MTKDSDNLDSTQPAKKHGAFRKFLGLKAKDKTSTQPSSQQVTPPPPPNFTSPVSNSNPPSPPTTVDLPSRVNFSENITNPGIKTALPRLQDRIEKVEQLVYCNTLFLQHASSSTPNLDKAELEWLVVMNTDPTEEDRLRWLATRMVEEFVRDATKDSVKIAEIVALGPVLDYEHYRKLLSSIISGFNSNSPGYLDADDLIKILRILRTRLEGTHGQTSEYSFHLTLAVSRLLDVMAEHQVQDLNRVEDHEPLAGVLSGLRGSSDPYLMYQACYAFQALQYVPDDDTVLQAVLRHSAGVASGLVKVSGLMKLDLEAIVEGLGDLQEALGGVFDIASTTYEGICSVVESGRGVMDSLKEGCGSGKKRPWYAAIRAAYSFAQAGQLKDLNQLVYEAPCRRDPLFQWGLCQLLGEIASDAIWDAVVRKQAIDLLGELYKSDADWGQDESVKTWMLNIIGQLGTKNDQEVSTHARTLLTELEQDQGTTANLPYPLRNRLPLPPTSPLLVRVLAIPDIEFDLYKLRLQRLEEHRRGVYIPPQAKPSLQAGNDLLFPLMEKALEFLKSDRQVLLVLGDSGAGKSTFNLELEHTLWKDYKKYGPIPLYINLPTIDDPAHDLIEKHLHYHNFSEDQIYEMKLHRKFILICDGYDESQLKTNIHTTNQFNQPGQWQAKIVISCRTQYLGQDYRSRFQPQPIDRYQRVVTELFQEAVIAAFTRAQIQQYVDEYVNELPELDPIQQKSSWTAEEYMDKLVNIPNLMGLVSNPFLLTLALDALPAVVASKEDLSAIRITRVQLYDSFVKRWLEINRMRLEASPLNRDERTELDMLIEDNFLYHGIHYQKDLATAIFIDHAGNPVVKYTHLRDKNTWKAAFFNPSGQAKLLRESSTVKRSGAFFRFLHRSLLEYFYSRTIYDPLDYDEKADDNLDEREPGPNLMTCLTRMNVVKEQSIVQFLAERVPQNPCFQQQLLDAIEESKADAGAALAAANSISILVKAGVSFNGADFRGIRIPGADISDGQFDSAQFQGADLTGVDFSRTWLRNADFSGAQLDDARFGELPFIEVECPVTVCAYSPDGSMLATGLEYGNIDIYNTTSWKRIHCLKDCHLVRAIAFSPDGQQLVSSGHGRTVRLRDIASGKDVLAMKGHSSVVKSVAFSPCGKQIASSSHELRLWDSQTGECLFILVGHTWVVSSVMYSPDGGQFVSGSEDGTIRFWDPATGVAGVILSPPLGKVHRLAYSHDGQWIASGHKDGGLQLWNAFTKEAGPVLQGHSETVTGIAFSPTSQWLVSSSEDSTLKLWDVSTGVLLSSLVGHQNIVKDVTVSPNGLQMASSGADKKIRLWETSSSQSSSSTELPGQSGDRGPVWRATYSSDGQSVVTISDHTFRQWDASTGTLGSFSFDFPAPLWMESAEFSPDRGQIASCGESEGSIQLWDSRTSAAGLYLEGHVSRVVELIYSPCGRWMASASWDNIVRIWDLRDPQQQCHIIPGTGDEIYESVGGLVFTRGEPPRLVIGSSNGIVRCFDPRSGEMVMSKKVTTARVQQLASSSDGQQLALGIDFSVHLWDLKSEKPSIELKGHTSYVYCIAYSPCGEWIASSSDDRTARLWHRQLKEEEEIWSCVSVVRGFFGTVQNITWNPVIPMEFLTGCLDGSVRVWRVILNDDGDKDTVPVKLVWGSNLRILCAEGLAFKDAVGLDPIHSKLLGQRGVVEGAVIAGGGDGWGEGEAATAGGDGWSFSGGVVTVGDVWGDSGAVVTGGDTWGDVGGVSTGGDTWGNGGEMSTAGDAWGEEAAVVSDGDEWGEESALVVEGDEWGVDEAVVTGK